MDNKFTVVCHEPGFAPVMFHHDTMEAAQACLVACEADGCKAKLATDTDDAARIWNEFQTQAVAAMTRITLTVMRRHFFGTRGLRRAGFRANCVTTVPSQAAMPLDDDCSYCGGVCNGKEH